MNIKEEHMNRMRQAIVKALQEAKSQPLRYQWRKATIRSESGSDQHEVTFIFDMGELFNLDLGNGDHASGVQLLNQEILNAALRSKVQDAQAYLRRLTNAELVRILKEADGYIFRDFLGREKSLESAANRMEKLKAIFSDLNKKQQTELMKQLQVRYEPQFWITKIKYDPREDIDGAEKYKLQAYQIFEGFTREQQKKCLDILK